MFDPEVAKRDFPILARKIHGKPLVYLDSAATAQKPQVVINAIVDYFSRHNANVHRGIHTLGDESTKIYHEAREKVAGFLGARAEELVFVRNTTEAINLVGYAWARQELGPGDLVVVSELEHHSNLVVWQEVARSTGAQVTFVDVARSTSSGPGGGEVDMEHLQALLETLGSQVKLMALTHVSNATGGVLDVARVMKLKKRFAKKSKVLIDGAQSVPQMKVDFGELGVDFFAFSGHKMYGPMGIGGLLVKREVLEKMDVFLVGGGMISEVHLGGTEYASLPERFDAGTPNVAGAHGLAAAVGYLEKLGMDEVEKHGRELVEYALARLGSLDFVELVGPKLSGQGILNRIGSVAFKFRGVHAHDVAQVLDNFGIAVRSGHHCTMPLHTKFEWVATTRASFGVYNSKRDVDVLVEGLAGVKKVFGG